MTTKKQLRKNRLDLEYHGEAQKLNAYLILLTTGIFGFLGSVLLMPKDRMFFGIAVTFLIAMVGAIFYYKSSMKMQQILEDVEKL